MPPVPKPKRKVDETLLERVREMPCSICGAVGPSDPSHIVSRGAGGDDYPFNVLPKCRGHHTEWHSLGWYRFMGKYPRFTDLLLDLGWEVDLLSKTIWHRGLR